VPEPPRYYNVFKLGRCVGQGKKGGGLNSIMFTAKHEDG
jgi:hypothetical protein